MKVQCVECLRMMDEGEYYDIPFTSSESTTMPGYRCLDKRKCRERKGEKIDTYFVISVSPDGISVHETTKEELEENMREMIREDCKLPAYLKALPDSDPYGWRGELRSKGAPLESEEVRLIIKGEIVTPKPRQVVTRYEIG